MESDFQTGTSEPRPIDRVLRWIGHRTWIPRRHRLVRKLWRRAYSAIEVETEFYGFRYRAQLHDWIDWNVYFFGAYAPAELAFLWRAARALRSAGRAHIIAADVGANVGHHALFLSKLFDEVWAIEPYEVVRERLETVIRRNRVENVRILSSALGETNGLLTFHPPHENQLGFGSFLGEGAGLPKNVRRGDDVFDEIGVARIDLLKIDTEGFEPSVLQGLSARLQRDRPVILIEMLNSPSILDEASLRPLLYSDAAIFDLRRAGNSYRLAPYEPRRCREAAVIPKELLTQWPADSEKPPRHKPGVGVWSRP